MNDQSSKGHTISSSQLRNDIVELKSFKLSNY
jgi:hypothetical protein